MSKEFNYVIGRYWDGKSGAVCCYSRGGEVHYSTQEDADANKKFIESETGKKHKIFELVEQK